MTGGRPAPAGIAGAGKARLASSLVTLACAIGFLLWARHQPAPHLPSSLAGSIALVLGAIAYTAATLGLCERCSLLLRRHAPTLPRFAAYRPVALGQLGNVFLPARAGDAIRVALLSATHEEVSGRTAIGTIVAERALDIGCHIVLLVIVLAGLFGPSIGALGRLPAVCFGLALLAVGVLVASVLVDSVLVRVKAGERTAGAARRAAAFLGPLFAPLIGLRRNGRRAVAISAAMWLGEIAGWWAAARATGLDLSFLQAAYVFAIASLALIMPVGFGSIGTLDAGILLAVRTLGLQTTAVLGFVVLLRVLFVLPSLALLAGLRLAAAVRGPGALRRRAAARSARRRQASAPAPDLPARPRR